MPTDGLMPQKIRKAVSALKLKKNRKQSGLILVEGVHPIEEAVRAGLSLTMLFYSQDSRLPFQTDVSRVLKATKTQYVVDTLTMKKLTTTDTPVSVAAVFAMPKPTALPESDCNNTSTTTSQRSHNHFILLDALQDPGNVGTILRCASAFGISQIVCTENSVDAFSPKVIRASSGLVFRSQIYQINHLTLSNWLSNTSLPIFLTGPNIPDAYNYKQINYHEGFILALGNEGQGLSLDRYNQYKTIQLVTVPMHAGVESLNVAMTAGIILSEAYSQSETYAKHA
ncbi:MAG: RNA methyltransferase [Cyanobacteria bacterium P01_H01_bin.74]